MSDASQTARQRYDALVECDGGVCTQLVLAHVPAGSLSCCYSLAANFGLRRLLASIPSAPFVHLDMCEAFGDEPAVSRLAASNASSPHNVDAYVKVWGNCNTTATKWRETIAKPASIHSVAL